MVLILGNLKLKLYNRYRDRVRTIILCIKGYEKSEANFNCGSLGYNSTVVNMSKKDGKKKLEIGQGLKNNLVAMTFVLSDKFLSDQEISEILRDYKMVRIFKYAEEQGEKKGERKLFKTLVKGNFEGSNDKIEENGLSIPNSYI